MVAHGLVLAPCFGLIIQQKALGEAFPLTSLLLQAPEVLEGDVASPTADVYAFGLVMWEVRWVTPGGWPALWGYCP
jgi:hypothetical protein